MTGQDILELAKEIHEYGLEDYNILKLDYRDDIPSYGTALLNSAGDETRIVWDGNCWKLYLVRRFHNVSGA